MKFKKTQIAAIFLVVIILLNINFVIADSEEFEKAESIVKQKIPCNQLSESDLEIIGDYYMEQMHPGELHEIMDERMGGEGSESLRQVHISIAQSFYCGNSGMMSNGMMNTMMNRGGMMGYNYVNTNLNNNYSNNLNPFSFIIIFLVLIILVLIILLLIKKLRTPMRRYKHG